METDLRSGSSITRSYVARKLHRTSASRFGTGIGIGTLWKLAESRFQNVSKIFFLKTCWKLTIPFWNHASVFKKKMQCISIKYKTIFLIYIK
ncbi:hypothetical protein IGI04_015153 [Brassica rapa subsp. trilocularis]|uniref:Uncharacterized protein n=1 Tax=Brassica rapa subsp. trilocularis TaxID=1813537 RepID=A0ABQ7MP84_BRACM|nr:hypothetical protein IGI04_015153 [Brassica rapa subsp. trilocularis]